MQVFFVGKSRYMVLYTYSHGIFQCILEGGQAGRPVLLVEDYREGFTAASYHMAAYYAYISQSGDVRIRSLSGRDEDYRILSYPGKKMYQPVLVPFRDELILFYAVGQENYEICGKYIGSDRYTVLPYVFPRIPEYSCLGQGDKILFSISLEETLFYAYSEEKEWECLKNGATNDNSARVIQEKDQIIESIKSQYEELMDTAEKYREEAKKWRDKYIRK